MRVAGVGTIINVAAIMAGGIVGTLGGERITQRFRESLHAAAAIAVLFIGIAGAMRYMASTEATNATTLLTAISIVAGALIGEALNLYRGIERFGQWIKMRTGNSSDAGFVDAFVSTSVTVCVGAMAVVGSIEDGISGNYGVLAVKASLDFVIVLAMACSLGKGCAFSAIPVALFQGAMTAGAMLLKPVMTPDALSNLSMIGSILIACVGINLLWGEKVRVANMLPAIFLAPALTWLPWF